VGMFLFIKNRQKHAHGNEHVPTIELEIVWKTISVYRRRYVQTFFSKHIFCISLIWDTGKGQ